MAFPSISTGIFGFPIELAAQVAAGEVSAALRGGSSVVHVTFVCFSDHELAIYEDVLAAQP